MLLQSFFIPLCFSGHFAIVRRARERRTGIDFAAKIIKKKKQANSKRGAHIHEIQKEVSTIVTKKESEKNVASNLRERCF